MKQNKESTVKVVDKEIADVLKDDEKIKDKKKRLKELTELAKKLKEE